MHTYRLKLLTNVKSEIWHFYCCVFNLLFHMQYQNTKRDKFMLNGNPKGTVHNDSLTKYSGRRVTGAYKNKRINSVF